MSAPSKAEQIAEGKAREEQGIPPGEAVDTTAIDDSNPGDSGQGAAPAATAGDAQPQQPKPLPAKSPLDERRDAIAKRFRADRGQETADQTDEISEFARSGMPPDFAEATAAPKQPADAGADQGNAAGDDGGEGDGAAEPTATPQTFKVKVRGVEKELTLEEMVAQAQIALASENYLDEAKARLKSAETLEAEIRAKAQQNGSQHPGAPTAASPSEPAPTASDASQHPGEDIAKLIETLQFGDPAEAATLFENTISKRAEAKVLPAVEEALRNQRLKDEGARTAKVLKDFEDQHADLAQDPMARAAIEAKVLDLQTEDLRAIGIDPQKLPTYGNRPVTPADIANAHRFYRSEGFSVRKPLDLLEKATGDFLAWKGVENKKPADPAAKPKPKVDISVDRAARRQAIPQQPNRTVTPRPDAQTQRTQPRDRSSIVGEMRAKRDAPRGRVVV